MSGPEIVTTIEKIATHEWFIAVYGIILWYALLLVIAIKKAQAKGEGESIRSWWKKMRWNIALTFIAAPYFIMFDDEIINMYNRTSEFDIPANSKIFYSLIGPLLEFFVIRWIIKLFAK